jgi:hypothetical protein
VGGGDGGERTVIAQVTFVAADCVFQERGRRQIGVNADRKEAMLDEGEALARDCAGLGVHTLLGRWRVAVDLAAIRAGHVRGRNYRQVERRKQLVGA